MILKSSNEILNNLKITIPDDIHGAVGVRWWTISDSLLWSSYIKYVWRDVVYSKEIDIDSLKKFLQYEVRYPFEIPPVDPKIGFFAYKIANDSEDLQIYAERSVGLIELRGKVYEHSDGTLRGQWARILCYFYKYHKQYQITDPYRAKGYQIPNELTKITSEEMNELISQMPAVAVQNVKEVNIPVGEYKWQRKHR